MQPPLTPEETSTLGEIIVNVLLFIGGWLTRLLTSKKQKQYQK